MATIVFQDDFSGGAGYLDGRSPDVGGSWGVGLYGPYVHADGYAYGDYYETQSDAYASLSSTIALDVDWTLTGTFKKLSTAAINNLGTYVYIEGGGSTTYSSAYVGLYYGTTGAKEILEFRWRGTTQYVTDYFSSAMSIGETVTLKMVYDASEDKAYCYANDTLVYTFNSVVFLFYPSDTAGILAKSRNNTTYGHYGVDSMQVEYTASTKKTLTHSIDALTPHKRKTLGIESYLIFNGFYINAVLDTTDTYSPDLSTFDGDGRRPLRDPRTSMVMHWNYRDPAQSPYCNDYLQDTDCSSYHDYYHGNPHTNRIYVWTNPTYPTTEYTSGSCSFAFDRERKYHLSSYCWESIQEVGFDYAYGKSGFLIQFLNSLNEELLAFKSEWSSSSWQTAIDGKQDLYYRVNNGAWVFIPHYYPWGVYEVDWGHVFSVISFTGVNVNLYPFKLPLDRLTNHTTPLEIGGINIEAISTVKVSEGYLYTDYGNYTLPQVPYADAYNAIVDGLPWPKTHFVSIDAVLEGGVAEDEFRIFYMNKDPAETSAYARYITTYSDLDSVNWKHIKTVDVIGDYGDNCITLKWDKTAIYDAWNSLGIRYQTTLGADQAVRWHNLGQARLSAFMLDWCGDSNINHEAIEVIYNIKTQ